MIDPNTQGQCVILSWVCVFALAQELHAGAAMGASFGCFCFLAFSDPTIDSWLEKLIRKFCLLIFSWGIGYAFGWALSKSPEWAAWAMVGAVLISAFAGVIAGAFNLTFRNNGPLPEWLKGILDRIPVLRKGNDET